MEKHESEYSMYGFSDEEILQIEENEMRALEGIYYSKKDVCKCVQIDNNLYGVTDGYGEERVIDRSKLIAGYDLAECELELMDLGRTVTTCREEYDAIRVLYVSTPEYTGLMAYPKDDFSAAGVKIDADKLYSEYKKDPFYQQQSNELDYLTERTRNTRKEQ